MTTAGPVTPHEQRPGGRLPGLVPALVRLLIAVGTAAVLALWWRHTGSVTGAGDWITGAGQITGLLAGYACAVLLLLMARVPLLDHAIGTDRLARWHAMGGRYTVCLASAHVLLIVWGYALTSGTDVVSQATTLILDYPDLLKGAAGFLLLLATGWLSARAVRRRVSYETWHHLHLATYLAVFLAFWHQLSDGADFVSDPPARFAWYGLYGAVAAALAWYRFVVPVRQALRHRLRVAEVRPEAPGVVSVYVTGRRLEALRARPGQFFRWRFLTHGMWWAANPYSLSAPAHPTHLRITVKAAGAHSAAAARLAPGTRVLAEGPYGAFTARRRRDRNVLLLAGGVGITPLRALFETLPGEVTLIYRARRPEDLALRGELDAVAAARHATVHYAVDEPGGPALPMTARSLRRLVPDIAEREVYLCGPPGMTHAAHQALRGAGVPRRRVHHESFAL
ncbi:ferric reductase-like transmembrane domain-containing protein [Streptomyces sp. TS71-3]|uniref:ferredoxin reductase family protein n=1 Tax=Streptomyces sp. TS71-3 TaxID=2733862 RepID=UPI001B2AC505|nr:ferredoxin reductase family protein [Streptomyces sp. TS71-3]GHJ38497.1 ferric reductase [Streptomyces sp. TS71-3]